MQRITIEDVAREAGVSTFTVSRALRGMDHVAAQTRDKVLRTAERLHYTASPSAAALASGQTRRVALLSRERIAGWFMGELLDGLYDVLSPAHYDLTVYRAGNTTERSDFFTNLPTNRNADALIVTGFSATEDEENALVTMNMPIVTVNSSNTSCCQGSVSIDDEASEALAVRYLAALGHRRFCYLGRVDHLTGTEWGYDRRSRGYLDEVTELGLENCAMYAIDPNSPRSITQAVGRILTLERRPTAICVWSDYHALAVIHELDKAGVQVPQDMSVFGFDGSDVASITEMTTMSQPAREIGCIAARKALDLIEGKTLDEPDTLVEMTLEPGISTMPMWPIPHCASSHA